MNVVDTTKLVLSNLVDSETGEVIVIDNKKTFTKEQRDMLKKAAREGRKSGQAFKRMLKTGIYFRG